MIIDGDLQDPPEMLSEFYRYFEMGYDVIYAIRENRKEGFIKRFCYSLFYRIVKSISDIDLPLDAGDFCFINRRVADELTKLPERSRYIRALRSWVGFRQIGIPYSRDSRQAGKSKYSFRMLFKLANDGLYNFSQFPIKLLSNLGLFGIGISFTYFIYLLITKLFTNHVPQGFTTIIFVVIFFGCLQLVCMGILGQYIIRIFFEAKGRPLYIIEQLQSNYTKNI